MQKLARFFKTFERKLSNTIDNRIKVAYALVRLARNYPRVKKAMSEQDINRAVQQHFRSEGLQNPPDVNWGEAFTRPVYRLSNKFQWSEEREEDIVTSVFTDILMGQNMDTGGTYKEGTLADWVRDMQEEGKDSLDILKIVQRRVGKKAQSKSRSRDPSTEGTDVHNYDPTQRGEEDSQNDKQIVLDILDLSPVSRGKADEFLSMTKRDMDVKKFMEKVDQLVQREGDENTKLLWDTIKKSPDWDKQNELANDEVTVRDPNSGRKKTMPLYKAMGKSEPRGISYTMRKLEGLLEKAKPMAKKLLSE